MFILFETQKTKQKKFLKKHLFQFSKKSYKMPISAEYSWSQTEETIEIQVALKGTPSRKVNVYISDLLVKVNFAPYLLQLDLYKSVTFDKSVARFDQRDGKLHLSLPKAMSSESGSMSPAVQSGPWKALVHNFPATASPSEKRKLRQERRAASMERKEKHEVQVAELVKETRFKNEKMTLRRQMAVEEDERQHIEELKTEEKEEAERAVYEQFSKLQQEQAQQEQKQQNKQQKKKQQTKQQQVPPSAPSSSGSASTFNLLPDGHSAVTSASSSTSTPAAKTSKSTSTSTSIWSDDEDSDQDDNIDNSALADSTNSDSAITILEDEEDMVFVPDPRETSTIKLGFTERFFPTPARESKLQEENDWLAKNGAHVGKRWGQKREDGNGKPSDARDISERDPMWLKGKGDDFYRSRDFQSAVNAYTAALAVDPDDPLLAALSNRAACYLQLGKYDQCRVDCSRVIECLPDVPNAAASGQLNPRDLRKAQLGTRSRILVRRGAASCELGEYSLAVVDYEEAISILLLDQEAVTGGPAGAQLSADAVEQAKAQIHALHADLRRIRNLSECSNLKEAGDAALRRKDAEQAVSSYTKAIELDASFVSALSNRAAAHLVLGKWQAAVDDCTAALTYLRDNGKNTTEIGAVPRGGSDRHASFTAKTLARRATALCKTGDYATAVADLQAALELDASNAKLVADLKRIQQLLVSQEKEVVE